MESPKTPYLSRCCSVYINHLLEYIDQAEISVYADDTAILVSSASYIDIVLSLRIELESVKQWSNLNKLMLNVKKAKFLVCGSRTKLKQVTSCPIKINNEEIEHVMTFKNLGLHLDQELTFVSQIYKKACRKLGALRKTSFSGYVYTRYG